MRGSIVVTGGGTGGHLKVAKEFTNEFHKRGFDTIFIGSKNGQDKTWFENDYHLKKAIFLETRGVVNKNFMGKLSSLWQIFKETLHCMNNFDANNVKTVISVGGFSAAPATFAAILTWGCKLYIHEQNSHMGRLNRLTARFATALFSSYDEISAVKDYPVNEEFFENKNTLSLSSIRQKTKDKDAFDVLAAILPGGVVTGAPKIETIKIIDENEATPRGIYGGAVGRFSLNGDSDHCLPIRSIFCVGDKCYAQTSAGIVYDSIPENEFEEVINKLAAMKQTLCKLGGK